MSPKWAHSEFAKIHEGCGGYVRWVEAYDQPGVGYTGECIACGHEGIVVEDIIPIRAEPADTGYQLVKNVDRETLEALRWDDDADWQQNQTELRQALFDVQEGSR